MHRFDVQRQYGLLEANISAEEMMIEVDSYLPDRFTVHQCRPYHELIAWLYPSPPEGLGFFGHESQPRFREIGRLAFVPASTPLTISYPREIRMHRVSILRIAPVLLDRIEQEHFRQLGPAAVANWDIRCPEVLRGMQQLAEETLNPGLGSPILIESLAMSLLIQLLRKAERSSQKRISSGGLAQWQLRRIEEYLADSEEADPQPTLSRLAALAGISSGHFRRAFKASKGCTIGSYIRDNKIMRARALLSDSRFSVEDIARRLGFTTSHGFSSAFRRSTGETPSAFRMRTCTRCND